MNIKCPHCNTQLNIPDHKIPQDREMTFKCPKCQDRVLVSPLNQPGKDALETPGKSQIMDPGAFFAQGRPKALVCVEDAQGTAQIQAACARAGFEVETVASLSLALKKMAYQLYPLVLADSAFDRNRGFMPLVRHMNEMDMSLRRRICFVLIQEGLVTGDNSAALHASINYIIGSDGLDHLDDILARALTDHENLYRVYNESMRTAGKA